MARGQRLFINICVMMQYSACMVPGMRKRHRPRRADSCRSSHLGYPKDEIVLVSGIGCSSRMPLYVDFNTLYGPRTRPHLRYRDQARNSRLRVIVVMGDGDAVAIGGNHFIHAARRNMDLTAIILNNRIYGMTGGQSSPTTPYGMYSTTDPYFPHRTGVRHIGDGSLRRRDLCRQKHGIPCPTAAKPHGKEHPKKGVFRGGGHHPLPCAVRKSKQAGNPYRHDERQRDQAVPVEKAQTMTRKN